MSKISFVSLALAASLACFPASAETDKGFYIGGFLGVGFPGDVNLTGTQNPEAGAPGMAGAPARVESDFDSDFSFGLVAGYELPLQFFDVFHPRLELEYSRISADVDSGAFNGGNQPFLGDTSIDFLLINNYTDIIWNEGQTVIPYFGGGLGVGTVDTNILYAGGGATSPNFGVVGDDTGLAGTFAGGLTWRTNENWHIYGEARYFQIQDLEFDRRFIGGGANLFNAKVQDDFDGSSLTLGVRYKF